MTGKTQKRGSRPKREKEAMDRFFRGLPVEEATSSLLIVANNNDANGAERGDPANCALAQACKRLFNSTAVLFFRRIAYIDIPNAKGERVVQRFQVPRLTRDAVVRFDLTGEFPPGGFKLNPPNPSETLAGQLEGQKRRHQAALRGERIVASNGRSSTRSDPLTLEGVRSGKGMVQFVSAANSTSK